MMTNDHREPETMEELISEIRKITKNQKAQSISDQVRVQQMLLNDPNYEVSIYDKSKGRIGSRNVHDEAIRFIADTTAAITGLDKQSARECAKSYKFTKKDANFFLNMTHDFMQTYLDTGRKLNIIQTEDSEASIFYRQIGVREKVIPSKNGSVKIPGYKKVIVRSKAPKYMNKEI
jgi:hypothetical protein